MNGAVVQKGWNWFLEARRWPSVNVPATHHRRPRICTAGQRPSPAAPIPPGRARAAETEAEAAAGEDCTASQIQGRHGGGELSPQQLSTDVADLREETEVKAAVREREDPPSAGCQLGAKLFGHGARVPRSDPCERCLCFAAQVICWQERCPNQTKPGCTERRMTRRLLPGPRVQ
ncbi:hypothetical protein MRX96_033691 [Rhipicephalus microplus]